MAGQLRLPRQRLLLNALQRVAAHFSRGHQRGESRGAHQVLCQKGPLEHAANLGGNHRYQGHRVGKSNCQSALNINYLVESYLLDCIVLPISIILYHFFIVLRSLK